MPQAIRAAMQPVAVSVAVLVAFVAAAAPGLPGPTWDDGPTILIPTQGRPVFVPPGGSFAFVVSLPRPGPLGPVAAELVSDRPAARTQRLALPPDADARLAAGEPVMATVPDSAPDETFTLRVRVGSAPLEARHCVAVGSLGESIRIVHLADMNVGDLAAPDFDPRLVEEINLVAPTVVVATGNYLDPLHPDPADGWARLSAWLSQLDAPAILACGQRDDPAWYCRVAAASPVGEIAIGPLTAIVLLDHPDHPLADDAAQRDWAAAALRRAPGAAFLVFNGPAPGLLTSWLKDGRLHDPSLTSRTIAYLFGGASGLDAGEAARMQRLVPGVLCARPRAASTTMLDGASGTPHYRILDMTRERAWPRPESDGDAVPPSVPVGSLRAYYDGPNDGSDDHVAVTLVNRLPVRLNAVGVRLRVRRDASEAVPECRGGALTSCVATRGAWECRVRVDLPDRSAVRVRVGYRMPPAPPLAVGFDVPDRLEFEPAAEGGTERLSRCPLRPVVRISLANAAGEPLGSASRDQALSAPVALLPLIRLDGNAVPYRALGSDARFAPAASCSVSPGQAVALELDLSALVVTPGRRELQVYPRGGCDGPPHTRLVRIEPAPARRN